MSIKHALVVDDSKSARFSLKKLLQQQDIKTDFAESAGDALNYLSTNTPDIIFMDHLMPGMDGFEATKAIKDNPDIQDIPIIMCTSKEGSDYAEQALAVGAYAILPKPAPAATLTALLNKLVTESKPQEAQTAVAETKPAGQPTTSGTGISTRVVENVARKVFDERIEAFQKQFSDTVVQRLIADFDEKLEHAKSDLKAEFQNRLDSQIRDQSTAITQRIAGELIDNRFDEISQKVNSQLKESLEALNDSIASAQEPSPALLEEVRKVAQFTAAATAGESAKETATEISQSIAQDAAQGELENLKSSIMEQVESQLGSQKSDNSNLIATIAIVASLVAILLAWVG